ncbi:hypothetical protein EMCRGX_G024669 [Ephydatia muelleri]
MAASDEGVASMLHFVLQPFLLRRVKSEVLLDLPEKSEVILYTGLSAVQKKLYKAILTKDVSAFGESGSKTRLMNVLVQLRKCVNHPYLFDGVEPEPFEAGEHLIEASGKLFIIDKLLAHLKSRGHRVLMFSQMTRMLDVIQDYRGYTYERLDGSVRGEERFLAVKNFSNDPESFVFLLSTRAGGQGLNLVGADTIIFVDSDFNPQNDLQAAARAHRIGQIRPVKVIRLLGKNTVEKVILKRAYAKLELTATVIEGGQFSHGTTGGIAVGQHCPSFPKRHSIAGDLVFVFDDPRAATPHSIVRNVPHHTVRQHIHRRQTKRIRQGNAVVMALRIPSQLAGGGDKPAAIDVSIASPLKSNILSEAGVVAGAAARQTEERKHISNDTICSELGWKCVPLVVETFGAWGRTAGQFFGELTSRLAAQSHSSKTIMLNNIYGRLSLTLVRANARAFNARLATKKLDKNCGGNATGMIHCNGNIYSRRITLFSSQ